MLAVKSPLLLLIFIRPSLEDHGTDDLPGSFVYLSSLQKNEPIHLPIQETGQTTFKSSLTAADIMVCLFSDSFQDSKIL